MLKDIPARLTDRHEALCIGYLVPKLGVGTGYGASIPYLPGGGADVGRGRRRGGLGTGWCGLCGGGGCMHAKGQAVVVLFICFSVRYNQGYIFCVF